MYESVIRYRCTSMLEAGYLKSGKILKFRNRASSSVRLLNRTQFSIERLGVVASADLCTPGLASARIALPSAALVRKVPQGRRGVQRIELWSSRPAMCFCKRIWKWECRRCIV